MKIKWWLFVAWGGVCLVTAALSLANLITWQGMFALFLAVSAIFGVLTWLFDRSIPMTSQFFPYPSPISEYNEVFFRWQQEIKEKDQIISHTNKEIKQWHNLIATIPFPIITMSPHGEIVFSNAAFRETFGEKRFCWEIPSRRFIEELDQILRKGHGKTPPIRIKESYFSVFLLPLLENRFLVLWIDKTESLQREEKEQEFIACAAHELKTPLTALQGYLELLEPSLHENQQKFFQIVKQHTGRLIHLSRDLLTIHRMELAPLAHEEINLEEIVSLTAALFRPRFAKKNIDFLVDVPTFPLYIEADSIGIEEILVNLLDNALRYTDEGTVRLSVREEDKRTIITCEDSGIGIAEKDIPHLFERFYVTDKSRSRETGGTGLGLSIVKTIVSRHHGTISVQSTRGRGSLFKITLPAKQSQDSGEGPS